MLDRACKTVTLGVHSYAELGCVLVDCRRMLCIHGLQFGAVMRVSSIASHPLLLLLSSLLSCWKVCRSSQGTCAEPLDASFAAHACASR